ncbi:hypothetical protein [Mycoplasma leonicaptivi]|uniref:hypothetical protein n=1 Tax=Mycoplasma leonicaptivi TaxID=36742 RepID=UPI000486AA3D|nr:hypothetical protein [Mycoplasma leonicaptivi]
MSKLRKKYKLLLISSSVLLTTVLTSCNQPSKSSNNKKVVKLDFANVSLVSKDANKLSFKISTRSILKEGDIKNFEIKLNNILPSAINIDQNVVLVEFNNLNQNDKYKFNIIKILNYVYDLDNANNLFAFNTENNQLKITNINFNKPIENSIVMTGIYSEKDSKDNIIVEYGYENNFITKKYLLMKHHQMVYYLIIFNMIKNILLIV